MRRDAPAATLRGGAAALRLGLCRLQWYHFVAVTTSAYGFALYVAGAQAGYSQDGAAAAPQPGYVRGSAFVSRSQNAVDVGIVGSIADLQARRSAAPARPVRVRDSRPAARSCCRC